MAPAGVLVLIGIGLVISTAIGFIVVTKDRDVFRYFRNRKGTDVESQDGNSPTEFEAYGNLIIPPDRKPTHAGMDIITRTILATSFPCRAVIVEPETPSTPPPCYTAGRSGPPQNTATLGYEQDITEAGSSTSAVNKGKKLVESLEYAADEILRHNKAMEEEAERESPRSEMGKWTEKKTEKSKEKSKSKEKQKEVFVVGEDEEMGDIDLSNAVDPMSYTLGFGSGKSMAKMYR